MEDHLHGLFLCPVRFQGTLYYKRNSTPLIILDESVSAYGTCIPIVMFFHMLHVYLSVSAYVACVLLRIFLYGTGVLEVVESTRYISWVLHSSNVTGPGTDCPGAPWACAVKDWSFYLKNIHLSACSSHCKTWTSPFQLCRPSWRWNDCSSG